MYEVLLNNLLEKYTGMWCLLCCSPEPKAPRTSDIQTGCKVFGNRRITTCFTLISTFCLRGFNWLRMLNMQVPSSHVITSLCWYSSVNEGWKVFIYGRNECLQFWAFLNYNLYLFLSVIDLQNFVKSKIIFLSNIYNVIHIKRISFIPIDVSAWVLKIYPSKKRRYSTRHTFDAA